MEGALTGSERVRVLGIQPEQCAAILQEEAHALHGDAGTEIVVIALDPTDDVAFLAIYAQRAGRPREQLLPEATGIFFRKGIEGRRLFHIGVNGKVDYLIDRCNNEDVVWKEIE